MQIAPLTRRRFLSNLALSTPASSRLVRAVTSLSPTHLTFLGIAMPGKPEQDRIDVYRVNDDALQLSASTAAAAPRALVLHPKLPVLYVSHCVAEHQHRPCGAVSAFRIDTVAANLSPLSHQTLTLAASHPDRIAIAPNGSHLAVASTSAGIINFFTLQSDGTILTTPSPLKLHSFSSLPFRIAFNQSGSAIFVTREGRMERLDILANSSLRRSLSPLTSSANTVVVDSVVSEPSAALKEKLAAPHAASLALLTL